jgi:hypothetical protein
MQPISQNAHCSSEKHMSQLMANQAFISGMRLKRERGFREAETQSAGECKDRFQGIRFHIHRSFEWKIQEDKYCTTSELPY